MADATQQPAQPVKGAVPAPTQVQHPPNDDEGSGAKGHNDTIKAKLTENLKKETRKRERAAAKAETGKVGAQPAPGKPRGSAAPDADKGKVAAKAGKGGKAKPEGKLEAKREAARKALEDEEQTREQLDAATGHDDDEEPEEREADGDDDKDLKRQRREFAKHKRKKDAEYDAKDRELGTREQAIKQFESRASEELGLFKKDPLAWLKARDIDVREVLVKYASEDDEDPKEKKIRELEQGQRETKEKLDSQEKQRAAEELKGRIQSEVYSAFDATDGDDYPNLWLHSDPESVARAGLRLTIEHYARHREKLAPAQVLDMLEDELISHNARKAQKAKRERARSAIEDRSSEPPDQVRSEKPVSPEARRGARRPSEDVTRRDTSLQRDGYRGTPGKFDREAARERMLEMTREHLRD